MTSAVSWASRLQRLQEVQELRTAVASIVLNRLKVMRMRKVQRTHGLETTFSLNQFLRILITMSHNVFSYYDFVQLLPNFALLNAHFTWHFSCTLLALPHTHPRIFMYVIWASSGAKCALSRANVHRVGQHVHLVGQK